MLWENQAILVLNFKLIKTCFIFFFFFCGTAIFDKFGTFRCYKSCEGNFFQIIGQFCWFDLWICGPTFAPISGIHMYISSITLFLMYTYFSNLFELSFHLQIHIIDRVILHLLRRLEKLLKWLKLKGKFQMIFQRVFT